MENEVQNEGVDRLSVFFGISRAAIFFRAIVFVLFGLFLLFKPIAAMNALTIAIGIYVTLEAIAVIISAFKASGFARGMSFFFGIIFLILGLFSVFAPLSVNVVWLYVIGIWQTISGFQYLFLPAPDGRKGMSIVSGLLSIVVGLAFITLPLTSLVTISWIFASLLIIMGIGLFSFAMALK